MSIKLPFIAQDDFGYDLNVLAEGMSEDARLELARRHYAACDKRQKLKLLKWMLFGLLAFSAAYLGIPLHLPWG